jgi:hypothetical protein
MAAAHITRRRLRTDDPVFLPDVRERQLQIDCEGFQFFGQGRHVEFVLRDDRLVMMWLMVTDAEAPTMVDAMTRAYGSADRTQRRHRVCTRCWGVADEQNVETCKARYCPPRANFFVRAVRVVGSRPKLHSWC